MLKLINKFRNLSFEEKTGITTFISVISNATFALGKFILAIIFKNVFFFVAGVLNIFMMISKLECFLGLKYPHKRSFEHRNFMIGLFLLLAGLQYAIYMGRLLYSDIDVMQYDMFLGIGIATISFIELGFAIKGLFDVYEKGHYYRNIKIINFSSAMTALVTTEIALMSFAADYDSREIDGWFGLAVGGLIVILGIFTFFAPKISLIDHKYNSYRLIESNRNSDEESIEIKLTDSKYYGNLTYIGKSKDGMVQGELVKGKSPIFKWNIWIKIFVIVLSEILIFPYAIGALIFYFKGPWVIKKLDKIMLEKGYEKIIKEEAK